MVGSTAYLLLSGYRSGVQAAHIFTNYLPNKHPPEEGTWEDQPYCSLSDLEEAGALRWIATSVMFWLDLDVKGASFYLDKRVKMLLTKAVGI